MDPPTDVVAQAPRLSIREVVLEHGQYVWRTLRHLGVRECDLDDVMQDVFLIVHRKLDGFRGDSSLKTWLYAICIRSVWTYRRKHSRTKEYAAEVLPEVSIEPEQSVGLERRDSQRIAKWLLEQLDEDKRQIFVLYEIEQLDMGTIVEIIGIPLQTGYSRLQAARKKVKEAYKLIQARGGKV